MKVQFRSRFNRDVRNLKDRKLKFQIAELIEEVEAAEKINQIPNLKKMKGHPKAFRIRFGSYRVGVFIDGSVVEFARIMNRREIYRYFP